MNVHDIQTGNLAMVHDIYAAFARGDVPAMLAACAPDIVWISGGSAEDFPPLGTRHGPDGAASFFRDVAAYDEFTGFEPRGFHASGDKVFVEGHCGVTAKATGKHFESDWVHVFTIVNGKTTRWQEFTDTAAFYKAGRP
jgi:ketosteroid isomerase-like protein